MFHLLDIFSSWIRHIYHTLHVEDVFKQNISYVEDTLKLYMSQIMKILSSLISYIFWRPFQAESENPSKGMPAYKRTWDQSMNMLASNNLDLQKLSFQVYDFTFWNDERKYISHTTQNERHFAIITPKAKIVVTWHPGLEEVEAEKENGREKFTKKG